MKKTLIALAVLATAGTAFAQSSVTLSGGIATQYSRTTTAGDSASLNDSGGGNTGFALSGTEDLGGGLKATVYMQQRFNSVTGATNMGGLGVNTVNVGLSGAFGAVLVGRIGAGSLSGYDAFGGFNENYARSDQGGRTTHDNAIMYTSPTISGFTVNVATTSTTGSATEYSYVRAIYTNGPLSVGVVRDELADAEKVSVGASYDLGVAKVMVVNGKATTAANVSTSNTTVGVRYPMGAMTLIASFRSGDSANASAIGVDYALSKRTGLYAAAESQTGAAQTAFRLGIKHSF